MKQRLAWLGLTSLLAASVAGACGGTSSDVTEPTGHADGGSGDDGAATGDDSTNGDAGTGDDATSEAGTSGPLQTVFVILMENHSWSSIAGNASAPYVNQTLLPMAAHAEHYATPAGNHPSEPNYIWLEAGDNLGITNDDDPKKNHQATKDHLVSQLEAAKISWKVYAEGIPGTNCPLTGKSDYAPRHIPQIYFDDITDTNSANSKHCMDHVRPYSELAGDLTGNKVARYNFITPDLCDDMHGETFGTRCQALVADLVKDGDKWLSTEVPKILASDAYKNNGVLFVMWDEGDEALGATASDGPLPFLVLSPKAKAGYTATAPYDHSSMLRTLEHIFGVPYLRGAGTATDLSDLFTSFP